MLSNTVDVKLKVHVSVWIRVHLSGSRERERENPANRIQMQQIHARTACLTTLVICLMIVHASYPDHLSLALTYDIRRFVVAALWTDVSFSHPAHQNLLNPPLEIFSDLYSRSTLSRPYRRT